MKPLLFIVAVVGLCCNYGTAYAQKQMPHLHKTCKEVPIRRTEIILPQVKGFNCYKADLHVHTSYSDGAVTPSGRVNEAWYDGLDILAITDHLESHSGVRRFFKVTAPYNEDGKPLEYTPPGSTTMPDSGIDPGLKVDFNAIYSEAVKHNANKGFNMLIVKGCEMARNKEKLGHYNALFVDDLNTIYDFDIKESFKKVKKQGGLIIHNHPGKVSNYETEWHAECYKEGLIDGVEVVNGLRYYPPMVNRCVDKKLVMVGGTDAHDVVDYRFSAIGCFRTMTIILAKELTEKAVKDALLKRRTIVYSGGDLIGEEKWLAEFLNAAIDCRMVKEDEKAGNRSFVLTNMSSMPFRIRRGRSIYELQAFKSWVVKIGKNKKTGEYGMPRFVIDNMWHVDYKHPVIELEIDK